MTEKGTSAAVGKIESKGLSGDLLFLTYLTRLVNQEFPSAPQLIHLGIEKGFTSVRTVWSDLFTEDLLDLGHGLLDLTEVRGGACHAPRACFGLEFRGRCYHAGRADNLSMRPHSVRSTRIRLRRFFRFQSMLQRSNFTAQNLHEKFNRVGQTSRHVLRVEFQRGEIRPGWRAAAGLSSRAP